MVQEMSGTGNVWNGLHLEKDMPGKGSVGKCVGWEMSGAGIFGTGNVWYWM